MKTDSVGLMIFTCENRERLLKKSYESFLAACDFKFDKIILAIDGPVDAEVISQINPDMTIYHHTRKGYVNSISKALKLIDTSYFFWLEDDWMFHEKFELGNYFNLLQKNKDWSQVLFSKYGPLEPEYKIHPIGDNLYQTTFGFSTNPSLCNTKYLQTAFITLENSPKGDKLGEDGFENFLSDYFQKNNIKSIIIDPVDHISISHDGYLESTPRNWHMTNSLEQKTEKHLLTIPPPPFWRKLIMALRLARVFFKISLKQFVNNEVYELCFRILASVKTMKKNG